jgi:hypothetical protein
MYHKYGCHIYNRSSSSGENHIKIYITCNKPRNLKLEDRKSRLGSGRKKKSLTIHQEKRTVRNDRPLLPIQLDKKTPGIELSTCRSQMKTLPARSFLALRDPDRSLRFLQQTIQAGYVMMGRSPVPMRRHLHQQSLKSVVPTSGSRLVPPLYLSLDTTVTVNGASEVCQPKMGRSRCVS